MSQSVVNLLEQLGGRKERGENDLGKYLEANLKTLSLMRINIL